MLLKQLLPAGLLASSPSPLLLCLDMMTQEVFSNKKLCSANPSAERTSPAFQSPSLSLTSSASIASTLPCWSPVGFSLFLQSAWSFPASVLAVLCVSPSVCLTPADSSHPTASPPLPLTSKRGAVELPLGLCWSATYFDTQAGKILLHVL